MFYTIFIGVFPCHLLRLNHTKGYEVATNIRRHKVDILNLLLKSHNAPASYPTMLDFVTEMCKCVYIIHFTVIGVAHHGNYTNALGFQHCAAHITYLPISFSRQWWISLSLYTYCGHNATAITALIDWWNIFILCNTIQDNAMFQLPCNQLSFKMKSVLNKHTKELICANYVLSNHDVIEQHDPYAISSGLMPCCIYSAGLVNHNAIAIEFILLNTSSGTNCVLSEHEDIDQYGPFVIRPQLMICYSYHASSVNQNAIPVELSC